MNEEAIIFQALGQLKHHTGITGKWEQQDHEIDGALDLYIQNQNIHFMVKEKRELREYQLPELINLYHEYPNFLVVAERIFPTIKEKLREYKIGYLDGGQKYLYKYSRPIDLDGWAKNTEPKKPVTNRAFTKTGLRTVLYLPMNEQGIRMPYRTIAKQTGVALGNIHKRLWTVALFLICIASTAYSQQKRSIGYLIPDTVKLKIANYLKDYKGRTSIYAILNHEGDTTSILICTYDKTSNEVAYLVSSSNRHIRLNSKTAIPVILQADIALSETLHKVKNKGTSNEIISNTAVQASGYLIVYKGLYWNISILKAEYYQN